MEEHSGFMGEHSGPTASSVSAHSLHSMGNPISFQKQTTSPSALRDESKEASVDQDQRPDSEIEGFDIFVRTNVERHILAKSLDLIQKSTVFAVHLLCFIGVFSFSLCLCLGPSAFFSLSVAQGDQIFQLKNWAKTRKTENLVLSFPMWNGNFL